jgi:DNA-binding response OmpR family regulator
MDHALRLGARECLHKPTDLDELCERVRAYCRRRDSVSLPLHASLATPTGAG